MKGAFMSEGSSLNPLKFMSEDGSGTMLARISAQSLIASLVAPPEQKSKSNPKIAAIPDYLEGEIWFDSISCLI